MDFSARSVWALTKLFVRDPAQAARRTKAMGLAVNVSVLMIVLSGVISGVLAAILLAVYGPQSTVLQMPDGTEQVIRQASPMMTGFMSALIGLLLAYLIYWVGARLGGTGTLSEVLSVIATFQIAMTVLSVLAVAVEVISPLLGAVAAIVVLVISLRALGHSVREGHALATMGRAVLVIVGAIFAMVPVLFILVPLLALLTGGGVQGEL